MSKVEFIVISPCPDLSGTVAQRNDVRVSIMRHPHHIIFGKSVYAYLMLKNLNDRLLTVAPKNTHHT